MSEIKLAEPKEFVLKLSHCGLDIAHGSYGVWKDKNPLRLLSQAVCVISKDFAGEENKVKLQYHLAISLLSDLNGWDIKGLQKSLKKIDKIREGWGLHKNKEEKP